MKAERSGIPKEKPFLLDFLKSCHTKIGPLKFYQPEMYHMDILANIFDVWKTES